MRFLITILFLISIAYGQNYPPYIPNQLYDKGFNWSPSIKPTSRLYEWESWTKGAAIDIGYQQFFGTAQPTGDGHGIKGMYYNCRQWATQLQAAGVQYCILTINTAYGFNAFDQKTMWPVPFATYSGGSTNFSTLYPSGVVLPRWQKDDLEQAGNTNFLYEFCYEMRRVGIEPILYIPIHDDGNRGGNISLVATDYPSNLLNLFEYYMCEYMQELILRFHIRYFWLDGTDFVPAGFMQRIYNAVKSVTGQNNQNECLIIANSFPGTEVSSWPFDIRTFEYFIYGGPSTFKNSLLINGIHYYVPTEMVNTAHSDATYYYQLQPGQTGYENITNQTQAQVNAQYELCQQYHARYCLFLLPDYLGNIPTSQLSLLTNLQ